MYGFFNKLPSLRKAQPKRLKAVVYLVGGHNFDTYVDPNITFDPKSFTSNSVYRFPSRDESNIIFVSGDKLLAVEVQTR